MKNSNIEWTDHTANYWWGCVKVSTGCANCYADTLSKRFGKQIWGANTERELKKGVWANVTKWDKEAREKGVRVKMFVQSMSDFFEDHPGIVETREMAKIQLESLSNIDVQLLTKRPENIAKFAPEWMQDWPEHIWIGTSVENQEQADIRIPELIKVPASVRFLSMEPLLGAVDLRDYLMETHQPCCSGGGFMSYSCGCQGAWETYTLDEIHWVIVGGESGHKSRPISLDWVVDLQQQCEESGVPFFFKQWGAFDSDGVRVGKKKSGRLLNGVEYSQFPVVLEDIAV